MLFVTAAEPEEGTHIFAQIHVKCANAVLKTDIILVLNVLIFPARNYNLN